MNKFPTPEEFKQVLLDNSLEHVVSEHIFKGGTFVFRERPELLQMMRKHLCQHLSLSEDNVIIVGSAKLGFSLSPDTFPREFSPDSDIDVVVVDSGLFDQIWMILLEWWYPRRKLKLGGVENPWASARRKEIFWGWLVPNEIRYDGLSFPEVLTPLRDISTTWFNAFKSLSLYSDFADRNISGRLYRTWDHAMRYHSDGLRQIRDQLKTRQPEVR